MKRWAVVAAMLIGLLGVLAAPAYADPTNAPNIEPFPITCDGVTYTVVTPGQGNWTPALVTTSNQVLIPFSFHLTVTNVATGRSVVVRVNDRGPAQPDRVGDVSRAAAKRLGMLRVGVVDARLEVVDR